MAALLAPAAGASADGPCGPGGTLATDGTTNACTYATAGESAFTVPAGVSELHVVAVGATGGQGADARFSSSIGVGGTGGRGAIVSAALQVTPSSALYVQVGADGARAYFDGVSCRGGAGGSNGGGHGGNGGCLNGGGGGGGGASDVRTSPASDGNLTADDHDPRLLVAGGGGGGGGGVAIAWLAGGAGGSSGGTTTVGAGGGGSAGAPGCPALAGVVGGDGNLGAGGGLGGISVGGCDGAANGGNGVPGLGGAGGVTPRAAGGGGGGGFVGGGAGAAADGSGGGGGGAGSSYGPYGATYATASVDDHAAVTISWTTPANSPPQATDDEYLVSLGAVLDVSAQDGVLANDSDADGDPLTVALATGPQHGTVILDADGSFGYQSDPGFVGTDTFTYVANDGVVGSAPATVTIGVRYTFGGFLAPIDGGDLLNTVKAGQGVPVKFSLGGDHGLDILAAASPSTIACDYNAPTDAVETTTAGNSGLTYDAATDVYTYTWKTSKAWVGACRELTLTLTDGTSHSARFMFTR